MASNKKIIGKKGENLALHYLLDKNYQLIHQNYHYQHAEIDLIMQAEDRLIFVEVKYRSSLQFGLPEESVSQNQKTQILKAAEQFIIENDWKGDIRFDIIAILHLKDKLEITHFEDAFY